MRRSVTSLICGLIGSLICLAWGFIGAVAGNIITGVSEGETGTLFSVLAWFGFFGAIVGIVGSALCVKKAKPSGAICLSIATILCGSFHIYCFAKIAAMEAVWMTLIVFTFLPVVLLIVSTVMAFCAKEQSDDIEEQQPFVTPQQPVKTIQEKTLEQELTDLKAMVEKGLLTEEEFAEAKKAVLAKHNK